MLNRTGENFSVCVHALEKIKFIKVSDSSTRAARQKLSVAEKIKTSANSTSQKS